MSISNQHPAGWSQKPLWAMFAREKDVGHPHEPMLSVFREHGVVEKDSRENLNVTADDRNIYQLVDKGWLVVNRMKAWQGSVGISTYRGIVSGHYLCFRPTHGESPRYLNWLLRSGFCTAEYRKLSRGVRPGQAEIDNDLLRLLPIALPSLDEQERIANFLDDQVAQLDRASELSRVQQRALEEGQQALVESSVVGLGEAGPRTASAVGWIGAVPQDWSVQPIGRKFEVQLGKMLAPDRVSGAYERPYLRNTNVQWDRIDTSDLMTMNFPPAEQARYRVRRGDLLVCEGGDIGRAAIWDGSIGEIYYQKALHRVRPRSNTSVRWLYYVLRAATRLGVFTAEGGLSTIAHLTGEQLRAHRVPIPPADAERRLITRMDERAVMTDRVIAGLTKRLALLEERKQALITAAVTGQFDVTTARAVA